MSATFVTVQSQRAFEEIETQVRKLIATGQLKPGDRLPSERALSTQLAVSRNTLREALRSLEIAGLVELRKGSAGGAFISAGKPQVIVNALSDLYQLGAINAQQLTEARVWIESLIVRVVCERATEEALAELECNVSQAVAAEKAGENFKRSMLHLEFHSLLARATRNPLLTIAMDGIMGIMREFVLTLGIPEKSDSLLIPSRKRLLTYLRARDADAAEDEVGKHLKRVHKNYLSRMNGRGSAAQSSPR